MRKFMDYCDTRVAFSISTTAATAGSGLLGTTAISCAGFGRARFTFVLGYGLAANPATFTGQIYCGTGSGDIVTPITSLGTYTGGLHSGIVIVDVPITHNAAGTAYSWLCASSCSVIGSAWNVQGIVDLYQGYRHPDSATPWAIITM